MQASLTNYVKGKKNISNQRNEIKEDSKIESSYSNRRQKTLLTKEEAEKKLIEFDLDYRYGPCKGITRTKRWDNSNRMGLNPPNYVRDLLNTYKGELERPYYDRYI